MRQVRNYINVAFSRLSNKYQPPNFAGLYCVGWIKSAHGIRGEIFVKLYAETADWLESLESFHLLLPNTKAPNEFPIKSLRPHKDGLIVVLEGVVDRNRAEELQRSGVYIPEELLESEDEDEIYLKQILGFQVLTDVLIGTVKAFADNGEQDLLVVERAVGPDVLIPFVEDFILNIDFDNKVITMELPEGLLDLEA